MVREFSEEKRQEIFRLLDEIDNREWKSFMEWCGSSAEEFGDWTDKLAVSAYTRYVDEYHKKVLEINEMTRQQVNTVFENVAEIDTRYAGRMRECQVKIKEQIAMVRTMTEFMQSMTDGNPNMALITKGGVNGGIRTEEEVDLTVTSSDDAENETNIYFLNDYFDSGEEFDREEILRILDGALYSGDITQDEYDNLKISFTEMFELKEKLIIYETLRILERTLLSVDIFQWKYNKKNILFTAMVDLIEKILEDEEEIRNLYNEIEIKIKKEYNWIIERNKYIQMYINENVLRDVLNYNIDKLDENFVEQLRALMLEGGIVTDTSILFFLATIGVETGEEVMFLEDRDIDNFNGLSYTWNTRGAGPMQVTGGTQMEFIKYLIDHTDDVEERNRLQDYYDGFESETKTIEVNGKSEEITVWDNTYKYNEMTVAEYIAEYYPYESAVWFWSYNQTSFEIDGQNLSINECIEQYNGVVDDDTMFLAVTCAVNGSEFKARGKGRFLNPDNDVDIVGDKIVLTVVDTTGEMAENDVYEHNHQGSKDGYEVYVFTSYIPNGWDRRSTLYDNLIDYFEEH